MPKTNNENPEKGRSRFVRRLQRLMRKLLWTNNQISHHRRPSSRIRSKSQGSGSPGKIKRRRPKRSLREYLFGRRLDWQTRLTGEKKTNIIEPQSLPSSKLPDTRNTKATRHSRHRNNKIKRGFLKNLFSRSKLVKRTLKPSEAISITEKRVQHSSVRYRKKNKNLFKRLFGRKDKKPAKLVLPSDQPHLPEEKESIIYRDYLPYFVNSTMLFMLAYLVAWLTYQIAVIITSSFFNIDSVLFFFEVMFPVGNSSHLWSSFNIILITISGPIISLIAGTLYYYFLVRKNRVKGNRLLFLNWLIVHSYCMFFAAFVAGVITNQGFGYVANWMYMNVFFKILFSLIFLFTLSWISFKGSRHILETANSLFRIRSKNRMIFLISQTVLPWLIGTLLLIVIKYPRFTPQHENILVYDLIIIVSVLFMIIPPFFNRQASPHLSVGKERKQSRISKWIVLITLIAILVFRVGLAGGIHFVIQFAVNISRYLS
jgi:hypothetical protein